MSFAGKRHTAATLAAISATRLAGRDLDGMLDAYAAGVPLKILAFDFGYAEANAVSYHIRKARLAGDPRAKSRHIRTKTARPVVSPAGAARPGEARFPDPASPVVSAPCGGHRHDQTMQEQPR